MTPAQARELAIELNLAATNAEVRGDEHIDLQHALSTRLRDSLTELDQAIAQARGNQG